jgi:peptidoglycan hydrolase-like protein with peptidoglycan-binding domain
MAFVSWVFAHTEVKAKAVSHNATAAKATSVSTSNKNVGTSKTKVATPKLKYSKTVEEYQKAYNVSYSPKIKLAEDGKAGEKTKATFEKIDLYRGIKHKATIVKFIQRKVGADDDGDFGKDTESKVKDYQKKHGIPNTGRVKKKTITKMVLG